MNLGPVLLNYLFYTWPLDLCWVSSVSSDSWSSTTTCVINVGLYQSKSLVSLSLHWKLLSLTAYGDFHSPWIFTSCFLSNASCPYSWNNSESPHLNSFISPFSLNSVFIRSSLNKILFFLTVPQIENTGCDFWNLRDLVYQTLPH